MQKIVFFFEMRSYGVCEWWARKLGIRSTKVRLGFIYASFLTLGSPLLIYLAMAWILEHKHYFKLQARKRNSIWEL
ncbi:MAG: PspC domain-containing protein [Bacteroidetes bacterium]|nr:MAG: PspC domain-containing protein [Bacteroidota bacterium]